MAGPRHVGVVEADDFGGLGVGHVDADPFGAQEVVSAAPPGEAPRPLAQQVGHLAVVDRGAGNAERRMHPHAELAGLAQAAVGLVYGRRQAVALVDAGRAGGAIGAAPQPAARQLVLEGEPGHAAEQRELHDRRVGAVQENAARLAVLVLDDLDVVGGFGGARNPGLGEGRRVGHRDERPVHPPAPGHADVDRVVGGYGIEVVAVGKTALGELIGTADVIELGRPQRHEHHPRALRRPRRRRLDGVDDAGDGMAAGQGIAAARFEPLAVHVGVGIEEAGARRPAGEVDDARRPPPTRQDVGRGAEGRDNPVRDGNGLGDAGLGIDGDDRSVVQDEIVSGHGVLLGEWEAGANRAVPRILTASGPRRPLFCPGPGLGGAQSGAPTPVGRRALIAR